MIAKAQLGLYIFLVASTFGEYFWIDFTAPRVMGIVGHESASKYARLVKSGVIV